MKRHYWIWIRLLEKPAAAQPEMALNYRTATRPPKCHGRRPRLLQKQECEQAPLCNDLIAIKLDWSGNVLELAVEG